MILYAFDLLNMKLGTSLGGNFFINIMGEFGYTSSRLFRSSVGA